MWLDDMGSLEGNEWGSEWWVEQQSEQQREKATKAIAGIKRTQKDEGKARRDNDFLHDILFSIITSGKFDTVLPFVFPLFEDGVPSNLIVGGFSLVFDPASRVIRSHYTAKKESEIVQIVFQYKTSGPSDFNEETLDPRIRTRINEWIEDIFAVVSHDPSTIMTERSLRLLGGKAKKNVVAFVSEILVFFFRSLNIHITSEKASLYADFIIGEVKKKLGAIKLETI